MGRLIGMLFRLLFDAWADGSLEGPSAGRGRGRPESPKRRVANDGNPDTAVTSTGMRRSGKVKWFNDQTGYGLIALDDGSAEVLVRHTAIQMEGFRTLADGDEVELDVVDGSKGPEAENVVKRDH